MVKPEDVIAVIPAFRAPEDLATRVGDLLGQVGGVVLVDDGSDSISEAMFADARVEVILLPENAGIARALNVGIDRARERGARAILTLDQDSTALEGYVQRLLAAAPPSRTAPAIAVPAVVGGAPVLRARDSRFAFDPIQAGQLIPIGVIDAVGGFDETLFIDAVDSEFTARVRAHGGEFVIVEGAELGHGLGELVPVTVFGRRLRVGGKDRNVLYHAPFRTYYMVRNSIVLARRWGRGNRRWTFRRSTKLAEMVLGCIVLAPDRGRQLRAVGWGVRHGLRQVGGRIPEDLARSLSGAASTR